VLNAELEEKMGLPAGWIAQHTQVLERRYSSGESAVGQAIAASKMALNQAGVSLAEVDAIIGASSTPHQAIPCTAALVQQALGAPDGGSACFDINATCLSFPFALGTVGHFMASGVFKKVLVFSSEIASPSLNPAEPESAALMGDAAAAAVLTLSEDASAIHGLAFATYSSGAHHTQILGGGTHHHPNSTRDQPELNLFHMNGPAIFKHAARTMPQFLTGFLHKIGWALNDVDLLVPHQASGPAVEILSRQLGFSPEQVYMNLPIRGNCVAASIPLALSEAHAEGRLKRGDKVLLAGTAAGLTLGVVALTF
jgi:3-oxoacyl-[acyl-carrier-protein] synthase-3